jgi:tetratricopeptide (TPR) repeat protein
MRQLRGCATVVNSVCAYGADDIKSGGAMIDRALLLNPNLAAAWNASGWVRTFLGKTNMAIENLSRALRLSPRDPQDVLDAVSDRDGAFYQHEVASMGCREGRLRAAGFSCRI